GYDEETCRMRIESVHPGFSVEDIKKNTGFELLLAKKITETAKPTEEELRVLREQVDPYRYIIGRG
ncbi:MAG: 3-oxoacid CoA-transferase, partial [Deltaproteobacteria bacterium]|nr:3-oxoacid CoA-transferase [Deltaproteobacteria bacterium]